MEEHDSNNRGRQNWSRPEEYKERQSRWGPDHDRERQDDRHREPQIDNRHRDHEPEYRQQDHPREHRQSDQQHYDAPNDNYQHENMYEGGDGYRHGRNQNMHGIISLLQIQINRSSLHLT